MLRDEVSEARPREAVDKVRAEEASIRWDGGEKETLRCGGGESSSRPAAVGGYGLSARPTECGVERPSAGENTGEGGWPTPGLG